MQGSHKLEPYYATDRRCYYGAWSSDMEYQFKRERFILSKLKELCSGAVLTYYPVEGKYGVSDRDNNYKSIIPELMYCKQEAMLKAIEILSEGVCKVKST